MALPVSWYSASVADNTLKSNGDVETASWSVAVPTITSGNFTATASSILALQAAVDGISIGNTWKKEVVANRAEAVKSPASSQLAQRENKFLCRYHDYVTGKKFRVALPCADLTTLPNNSEFIDLSTGVGATLKSAFEAIVVSPDDSSNATILDSVQFVGRKG